MLTNLKHFYLYSGDVLGGTQITIKGNNFRDSGVISCKFGDLPSVKGRNFFLWVNGKYQK